MKCPMCSKEIPQGADRCSVCGCAIVYNGYQNSASSGSRDQANTTKNTAKDKKKWLPIVIIAVLVVIIIILLVNSLSGKDDYDDVPYTPSGKTTSAYVPGNQGVYDWMQDQAEDKDYGSPDGGEYYCMGKNDTCQNRTYNAYDLYCDSCDPNGDNIEG